LAGVDLTRKESRGVVDVGSSAEAPSGGSAALDPRDEIVCSVPDVAAEADEGRTSTEVAPVREGAGWYVQVVAHLAGREELAERAVRVCRSHHEISMVEEGGEARPRDDEVICRDS
jgi:hypothetical protein